MAAKASLRFLGERSLPEKWPEEPEGWWLCLCRWESPQTRETVCSRLPEKYVAQISTYIFLITCSFQLMISVWSLKNDVMNVMIMLSKSS